MAPAQGWARRYFKAFCKGFFVAVPVAVTFLDRVACVARVEGASMQPSLNPGGSQSSDVVLLNHWKVRNLEVHRGDIVSLVNLLTVSASGCEQYLVLRAHATFHPRVRTAFHRNRVCVCHAGNAWAACLHIPHPITSSYTRPALLGLLSAHRTRVLQAVAEKQEVNSWSPPSCFSIIHQALQWFCSSGG
ncbi:hypothetical protein QTO34_004323 [Cnephaeus nilssonii]|uniref:Mitochondrial inner membrane protease subunit 2 n=1 Tax=Cnephaeus nilssonii TaxID=3371016 RepID=A0AA40LJN0_CNENI|nr:hypothetical protein QTO34_004323 [Eptesicus nilssonii]